MSKFSSSFSRYVESKYPLLVEILETANPSGEEDAMRALVERECKKLGARIHIDDIGNLVAYFGKGDHALLIGAHLDSVMPCKDISVVRKGTVLRSAGDTILSGDDGAGIFEVLVALHYLHDHNIPYCPIDAVFTVREEIGGTGVHRLDVSKLRAKQGVLFDRASPPGYFVIESPHKINFRIDCHGRSAHALEAEKGLSALALATECVQRLPQGKIKENVYINLGKIRGGHSVNQVPDHVVVEGELRSFDAQPIDALLEKYERTLHDIKMKYIKRGVKRPEITFKHTARRRGYVHDQKHPLIKHIRATNSSVGIRSHPIVSRGCSDAGELTHKGVFTVNYANGTHEPHTCDEWLDMRDVTHIAWFAVEMIREAEKAEKLWK